MSEYKFKNPMKYNLLLWIFLVFLKCWIHRNERGLGSVWYHFCSSYFWKQTQYKVWKHTSFSFLCETSFWKFINNFLMFPKKCFVFRKFSTELISETMFKQVFQFLNGLLLLFRYHMLSFLIVCPLTSPSHNATILTYWFKMIRSM